MFFLQDVMNFILCIRTVKGGKTQVILWLLGIQYVVLKYFVTGKNLAALFSLQVQNEFILATERDSFVEQVREIIEKADEMLSEDVSVEPEGDQGLESMQTKDDGFIPGSQVCRRQMALANHILSFGWYGFV